VAVTIHHGRRWSFDLLWKEPKGDDLPTLPPDWTRLSPSEWRQWAEQYAARLVGRTHLGPPPARARAYVVRRSYDWCVRYFFERWAHDETEISERKEDAALEPIRAYAPGERRRGNFRVESGRLLYVVLEPGTRQLKVHAVHRDPHYRKAVPPKVTGTVPVTSRPRRKSDADKELAERFEAIQRDRKRRGEDVADPDELRRIVGEPRQKVRNALKLVSPDLKRPPGQRRKRRK